MQKIRSVISREPLNDKEKKVLEPYLAKLGLDPSIWLLYDEFMRSGTPNSIPVVYKLYKEEELLVALFLFKCYDYGLTITNNKLLSAIIRKLKLPVYVWMRSSIAAELFANPGFFNLGHDMEETREQLLTKLRSEFLQLFVLDLLERKEEFPESLLFPYPDEGMVSVADYETVDDYISEHGNIKKKIKKFNKIGGRVEVLRGSLDNDLRNKIYDAVVSTGQNSIFTLPYQDAYAGMCRNAAGIEQPSVVHFICRSDDEFYGYHSFMEFQDHMRCLNGAFNRRLKTTFHAYENMIVKTVEYATDRKMKKIFYGPVLNETKRRMMNQFGQTKVFFLSKSNLYLKSLALFLKGSKMQSPEVLRFSGLEAG